MSAAVALPFPRFSPPRLKSRSKAFGLLEVILVFAIVIAAAAVVFTVFGFANASSESATIVDETNLIAANLRASPWGIAHNFSNIPGSYSDTYYPGIFPAAWNESGTAIEPTTGYSAWIGPGYSNQPNTFSVLLNFVPTSDSECQRVGSELAAQGYDNVMFAAAGPDDVGGTIFVTTAGPQDPPTTHTINQAQLAAWCGGVGGSDTPGYIGFEVIGH